MEKKNNKGKSRSNQKEVLEPQTKKTFETKRELAKEVVMEIFYSSPNSKVSEAVMFRKAYPSIHKTIKCFYENGIEFSQLLTTIEAFILLDIVAKQISVKYPNMPLGSIHDCLITTTKHQYILNKEMKYLIEEATTLKVKVDFESNIENTSLLIEPMLLIPFVENAFKHGTGMIKEPTIDIKLETKNEGIYFEVRNVKSPTQQSDSKDSSSGIGLANVKRRLDLLYKKRIS